MKYSVVGKTVIEKAYKKRDAWTHKGHYGKVLVIAGSERITGSPVIVGTAALRAGADIVYLCGPRRAMDSAAAATPFFINQPLEGREVVEEHLPAIISFVNEMKPTCIAIGPGLWRSDRTRRAVIRIVENFNIPFIIDADAIRAVSAAKEILKDKLTVITPHANEFKEFSGIEVSNNLDERIEVVKNEAKKWRTVIILKGHVDVISDGRTVAINKTGNPFMSKGGCGDTLTGICAALMSREVEILDAFTVACASAYINGRAGDLAARELRSGLLPTDLISKIPYAIR